MRSSDDSDGREIVWMPDSANFLSLVKTPSADRIARQGRIKPLPPLSSRPHGSFLHAAGLRTSNVTLASTGGRPASPAYLPVTHSSANRACRPLDDLPSRSAFTANLGHVLIPRQPSPRSSGVGLAHDDQSGRRLSRTERAITYAIISSASLHSVLLSNGDRNPTSISQLAYRPLALAIFYLLPAGRSSSNRLVRGPHLASRPAFFCAS